MKPQPAEPATPALNVMSVWAYLIGILAVGTFFLARFGLPFILAVLALIIGVGAYVRDKQDRRALVASVLGALAIVLAVVYLALR